MDEAPKYVVDVLGHMLSLSTVFGTLVEVVGNKVMHDIYEWWVDK